MAARKSAKAPAAKKKAVSPKAAPAAKKKAVSPKAAPAAKKKPTASPKAAPAAEEKTSVVAKDVNLGHVFALRPRISTSFRQPDFLRARELLVEESYASVAEAARAVAEKALELTHDGPQGRGKKGRRGP
jgi:hypothetical protein